MWLSGPYANYEAKLKTRSILKQLTGQPAFTDDPEYILIII